MWKFKEIPRRYAIVGIGLAAALLLGTAGVGYARKAIRLGEEIEVSLSASEKRIQNTLSALHEQMDILTLHSAKEYLVRSCEGGIGIYDADGTVLYELLEVSVRTLPAADRAMLERGILVIGEAALRSLCEDYSS